MTRHIRMEYLKDHDLRYLSHLLSPDYIVPAATEYGLGDPVMGAGAAWKEIKGAIRNYYHYIAHREKVCVRDIGVGKALRSLGVPINAQEVMPDNINEWREVALEVWDRPIPIPGFVDIYTGNVELQLLRRAFIITTCNMLKNPELNKSILQGRIYQRFSSEVMIYADYKKLVWPIILDASDNTLESLNFKMKRRLRALIESQKSPLRSIGLQIYKEWIRHGMISSPAGAALSAVGEQGVPAGHSALVPFNGVPITITTGVIQNGWVRVGCNFDHRVFDAYHAGLVYQFLKEGVQELCERWSLGGVRGSDAASWKNVSRKDIESPICLAAPRKTRRKPNGKS